MFPVSGQISWALAARAAGLALLLQLSRLVYRLVTTRLYVRRVAREHGIPLIPHSLLVGHLGSMAKVVSKAPSDVCTNLSSRLIMNEYPDMGAAGAFYLDAFPINFPMLVVTHPDMIAQFTQEHSLLKPDYLGSVAFHPLAQGRDLLTTNGRQWKTWRSALNPGFSSINILKLVPAMLEETSVYLDFLRSAARGGETVQILDYTTRLFVDIIGQVVLGTRLETLTRPNAFMDAFFCAVYFTSFELNPIKEWHPLRPFYIWNSNRIMKRELMPHIKRSIAELDHVKGPKTVLHLALRAYAKDAASSGRPFVDLANVDPDLIDDIIAHLKIFMLAGSDTSSTTLCWLYYLLDKHSDKLARMREEHDTVLGADVTKTAAAIAADPSLLNQLPYTQAAIKETLRLYPPVSSIRQGEKGFYITHPETGVRYPTEGFLVWGSIHASHRSEFAWEQPNSFIPERWLIRDESNPLYPRKNAWRPFEHGNRACIGQELAQIELRLVVALTIREFSFSSQLPLDGPKLFGEIGYQVYSKDVLSSQPKDGMPMKISIRQ
ncbi:hypothetical protein RB595_000992 [Gaeumannomyces hyphopodioides]